jgi:hypothetical protein
VSGPADSVRLAAAIYVRLGNLPKAFELLDRLHAARDKFLPTEMRNEPFASLRSDPRYRRLLARMNLP